MITTVTSTRKNPCYKCPDRYPACSGHCQKPEFLAWKEEQALIRKNRQNYAPPAWIKEEGYIRRKDRK